MSIGRQRSDSPLAQPRRYAHYMVGLVLAAVMIAVTSSASGAIGWRGDYETGDFTQWGQYHVQANPGDAVIVSDVVHQGRYAAKFTVNPGDNPIGSTGERAQIYASQSDTDGYEGHEDWWAWSTMIEPGSVLYNGGWNDLTAFHQTGPSCPAPVHVAVDYSWNLRLDAWGGPLDETKCLNPYRKTWQLGQIQPGTWYDIVFHVKWSPDPNVGFIEVYINGKIVVPKTNAATIYAGQGVYLKQGLNRGATSEGSTVVYNDGTRRGSSYSDVIADFPAGTWPDTPGGSTPMLPPPTISGSPVVGSTLTAYVDPSSLAGDPISVTYQWRACDSSGGTCADVTGATGPTYVPTTSDLGKTLRVRASAKTSTGTYSSTSDQTAAVTDASPPVLAVTQSITGGQTLSGKASWTATPSATVSKVEFWVDGALKWTENYSPYVFNGDGATLDTSTLSNASHTFSVKAYASNGTTATATAAATVSNTSSTTLSVSQSITSGQTLSGKVTWTATPSTAVSKIEFSIDGTLKWTGNSAPYVFNGNGQTLDTTTLANGSHTFSVKAYASNGTATATATATVSNSSSTTLTVSQSITNNQTLSGKLSWTATPGTTVSKVEFSIDGALKWTENISPYVFDGDGNTLDTSTLSNATHTFSVKAYASNGTTATATATATVSNGSSSSLSVTSNIADGQTLSGSVTWTATVAGTAAKVKFCVDGSAIATLTSAPYSTTLDTTKFSKGNHKLTVKAFAADGTTATASATVKFSR